MKKLHTFWEITAMHWYNLGTARRMIWRILRPLYLYAVKGTMGKSPHTGRFATNLEQRRMLSPYNGGMVVDGRLRLSRERSYRNLVVTGNTGSGKSSVVFQNFLLRARPECSMITLDCSGQLYAKSSGYLESAGFRVLKLDFTHTTESEQYNPLQRAESYSEIKKVANTLIRTAYGSSASQSGSGNTAFWNASAAQLLYVVMATILMSQPRHLRNLANVRYVLNHLSHSKESRGYRFIRDKSDRLIFDEFKGVISAPEKVVNSILATCRTALEKLADPDLAELTSRDSLGDFALLRKRPTALFLCCQETDIEYVNGLISLVLSDLYGELMKMPDESDLDVYLLLDEVGHFSIEGFSKKLLTSRKRRIATILGIQSKASLRHQYGEQEAEAIFSGGTASQLLLPGSNNIRENEELMRLLGNREVEDGDKKSVVPLLSPDELYAMRGKGVFLTAGSRPMKLKLHPYYKNRTLRKRSEMLPVRYPRRYAHADLARIELTQNV